MGSTITLQCPHTANPAPRSYRWEHTSTSQGLVGIISEEGGGAEEGQGGHYRLSNDALTIVNATVSDEGFYLCNVTNQCGSDFVIYFVEILGKRTITLLVCVTTVIPCLYICKGQTLCPFYSSLEDATTLKQAPLCSF